MNYRREKIQFIKKSSEVPLQQWNDEENTYRGQEQKMETRLGSAIRYNGVQTRTRLRR